MTKHSKIFKLFLELAQLFCSHLVIGILHASSLLESYFQLEVPNTQHKPHVLLKKLMKANSETMKSR